MKANLSFERYESHRDWLDLVAARLDALPDGSDEYDAQSRLYHAIKEGTYGNDDTTANPLQEQHSVATRKYREEHGWRFSEYDCQEVGAGRISNLGLEVDEHLPREATTGYDSHYAKYRIPEIDGACAPLSATPDSVETVLGEVRDHFKQLGVDFDADPSDTSSPSGGNNYDVDDMEPAFQEIVQEVDGIGESYARNLRQYVAREGLSLPEPGDIEIPVERRFNSLDEVFQAEGIQMDDLTVEQMQTISE